MSSSVVVGDRVQFDGKRTSWLARAATDDGRYTLLTASMFGDVYYTIIDWQQNIRGPMNVIGWGLGITTRSGPDENIDKAIRMLRPSPPFEEGETSRPWDGDCGFEVSHRGQVALRVTRVVKAAVQS
jgi:hypothetical protein